MAGAPTGADAVAWLNANQGTQISSRNLTGGITAEETVYLTMVLYQVKTNTQVANIQIRNYSATAGITGISEQYKTYVRAAFEVGVCTDKKMQPQATMKVKDFLNMIAALNAKVKL